MAEITLRSISSRPLKNLVEIALQNELRVLEAGIARTLQKLQSFEKQFQMSTNDFVQRFNNDQLHETLEFAEWIGEYRMLERLREKANTLREVEIAN